MTTLDLVVTNNSIKKDAEMQRKDVVYHKKHVVDTIALLSNNIAYLQFAVSKYRNSDKYDYLYNLIANKYNFKMADDPEIDSFMAKNGIYRTNAFAAKKMKIFNAVYASIAIIALTCSYYYGYHAIIAGFIVLSLVSIIFAVCRKNFLETHSFYKVNEEFLRSIR